MRRQVAVTIEEGAVEDRELLSALRSGASAQQAAGLHLELLRSGALRAQATPLARVEARIRLDRWTRQSLEQVLEPSNGKGDWRSALQSAFIELGQERFGKAVEGRSPLSVLAVQVQRPTEETFARPGIIWELVESFLVERHPAACLLQLGRRICALLPLGLEQGLRLAGELGAALAQARKARTIDLGVSIGVSNSPEDSQALVPLLRLAQGAALRANGRGQNEVERGKPVLLIVGEKLALQVSQGSVLERLGIEVKTCPPDKAVDVLTEEHPTAVLLHPRDSGQMLEGIATVSAAGLLPFTRLLFASTGEESEHEQEVLEQFPGATAMFGRSRLESRVLEEVASTFGLRQRRYPRRDVSLGAALRLVDHRLEAQVVNLSESGVRVVASAQALEEPLFLELELPACSVRATTRIAWQRPNNQGCEAGLYFERLSEAHRKALAAFVGSAPQATPARSSGRVMIEPTAPVEVRVRPKTSKASHVLQVINLSEGGCLAKGSAALELELGTLAELGFTSQTASFSCAGELVRREKGEDHRAFAFRFLDVDAKGRAALQALLVRSEGDLGGPPMEELAKGP